VRYRTLLVLIFVFGLQTALADSHNLEFKRIQAESMKFNSSVTDEEIIEYNEFQYKNAPKFLEAFRQAINTPEKRKEFLENYRKGHNEAAIQIPVLRGADEERLKLLEEIFEFKRKEYYESEDAKNRMEEYTKEQLQIVFEEGKKLLNRFDELKSDSQDGRVVIKGDDFPDSLSFLELKYIYINERSCRLFLQKGIGRGIGYEVSNWKGDWKLQSFNEYVSWERQEIKL